MPRVRQFALALLSAYVLSLGLFSVPSSAQQTGGSIRIAVSHGHSTDSIDPVHASSDFMFLILAGLVGDTLTVHHPGGQVIGELAENWDVSEDYQTWTFRLQPNVLFHSGRHLTASDVIYSFGRFLDLEDRNRVPAAIAAIESMEALDDHTVVFELKHPSANFASGLTSPKLIVISSGSIPSGELDGTGPYVLREFQPGQNAIAEKRDDEWRENRVYFDNVEVWGIGDETARYSALLSGEFDVIDGLSPNMRKRAQADGLSLFANGLSAPVEFAMDVTQPPFDNARVRKALKLAMDRDGVIQDVYDGAAIAMHDFPIDPAQLGGLRLTSAYDPERAQMILLREGERELTLDLHVSTAIEGSIEIAEHFATSAARAGISINIVRAPSGGYWSETWARTPFYATRWWTGGDPQLLFQRKYDQSSDVFERTSIDPVVTETAKAIREHGMVSFTRFREVAGIVAKQSGSLIAAAPVRYGAFRGDIGPVDGTLGRYGTLDDYRLPKRWSFGPRFGTPVGLSPFLDCAEGECACAGSNLCANSCCD